MLWKCWDWSTYLRREKGHVHLLYSRLHPLNLVCDMQFWLLLIDVSNEHTLGKHFGCAILTRTVDVFVDLSHQSRGPTCVVISNVDNCVYRLSTHRNYCIVQLSPDNATHSASFTTLGQSFFLQCWQSSVYIVAEIVSIGILVVIMLKTQTSMCSWLSKTKSGEKILGLCLC